MFFRFISIINPKYFLCLGLIFSNNISCQELKENKIDTLKIIKKALNSNSFQFQIGTNTSQMRRKVIEGYLCDYKARPRIGYNFGFDCNLALKKERSLTIGTSYVFQRFSVGFSRETLEYEYFEKAEDYLVPAFSFVEFRLLYNKYFRIKKNFTFLKISSGLNYGIILSKKNNFGGYNFQTVDGVIIQMMNLETIYNPQFPSMKLELSFGKVKKDLNLISLSLFTNIAFTNNINYKMTVMPNTKYQAIMEYKYNGSYIGLKLCYTSTKMKKK